MSEDSSCIFCKIARGEIKSDKIAESDNFFSIMDIDQSIKGHMLIIPKKHFVTLLDIPDKLGSEMLRFSKQMASFVLEKKYGDGFNIIMNNLEPAGQVVKHAHIHIIPRKDKDGMRFLVRV